MSLEIRGLGTATPQHRIDQAGAADIADAICCETPQQFRMLGMLYRRAGVQFRHSVLLDSSSVAHTNQHVECGQIDAATNTPTVAPVVDRETITQSFFEPALDAEDCGPTTADRMQVYEHHAGKLAVTAAKHALDRSGFDASEITHLITVSCTGFSAPGVDHTLIRECDLSPSVSRTHVGFMGCHGAINGMRVGQAFADADPNARVLLCAVELCSLHQQYGWHPDRIVSNSLFADGAAALVGCCSSGSGPKRWKVEATGSAVIPETGDLMGWHVRDHGFEMNLSSHVPKVIRETLHPWLTQWLSKQNLTIDDIGTWAVHPGGPRILHACADAIGVSHSRLDVSQQVLAEYGNMSSPTILFILERLMQQQAALPCVTLAFGPGLSIEAALIV